jgi:hypothetical protein
MNATIVERHFQTSNRKKKSKYVSGPINHRNIFCEQYEECLAIAAYDDSSFNCEACPHKDSRKKFFLLTLDEIDGCSRLLYEIFKKTR